MWLSPRASVAHPLDDGPAVMIYRSLERTAAGLGGDSARYARLVGPFLERPHELLADVMAPLRVPEHPILMLRFGLRAIFSANRLARAAVPRRARARAVRGLRGTLGAAALAAAHRRAGAPVRDHRARRGLAGRAGRIARDHARARVVLEEPRRCDRDEPAHRAARRAAARTRGAIRHLARPARADRGRGVARALPATPLAVSLRARRVQGRLGARRADPVARSHLPRGLDRARRRHARGDLRVGARHVRGPSLRAAVPDPVPAERDRCLARARGPPHRLRLLPRPARLDDRPHRGDRGADRSLRAGLPRPHPRTPPDEHQPGSSTTTRTTSAARSPAASPTRSSCSIAR